MKSAISREFEISYWWESGDGECIYFVVIFLLIVVFSDSFVDFTKFTAKASLTSFTHHANVTNLEIPPLFSFCLLFHYLEDSHVSTYPFPVLSPSNLSLLPHPYRLDPFNLLSLFLQYLYVTLLTLSSNQKPYTHQYRILLKPTISFRLDHSHQAQRGIRQH